jgi:hypothetical protein
MERSSIANGSEIQLQRLRPRDCVAPCSSLIDSSRNQCQSGRGQAYSSIRYQCDQSRGHLQARCPHHPCRVSTCSFQIPFG